MPPGSPPERTPWSGAELALAAALPATVFAFTMGSSSVPGALRIGLHLRWVLLFVLAGIAVVFGWPDRGRISPRLVACVGGLGAVGLLSATWSVTPRITAERAVSFLLLGVVAVFVGAGALRSKRRRELVLVSLLAGPALVALAGLVVYVADHRLAVQPAAPDMPERLRGFGQNPNTASMLFAIALPLALWLLIEARTLWVKATAAAVAVLLYGSVLASNSRGAMLASAAGVIVFAALRVRRIRVLVPLVAVLIAGFAASFQLASSRSFFGVGSEAAPSAVAPPAGTDEQRSSNGKPSAERPGERSGGRSDTLSTGRASRLEVGLLPPGLASPAPIPFVPEENEIGFPGIYESKPLLGYGSGRVYAWLSALKQGLKRPILGYGFGTQQYVFVDRSYVFNGSFAENSFVGMFLELGTVGVLLLLVPFAVAGWLALEALRRRTRPGRTLLAVGVGTIAAGFVIAFFQSYLYSVGNVSTLTFWIVTCLTLIAAAGSVEAGS